MAVGNDGSFIYSNVIQVIVTSGKPQLTVFPTLIASHNFNLHCKNIPTGIYQVVVYNLLGQTVFRKIIQCTGGEEIKFIDFGNNRLAAGAYEVQVANSTGTAIKRVKVVVE